MTSSHHVVFESQIELLAAVGIFLTALSFPSVAQAQCQGGPDVNFYPWARHWQLNASQSGFPAGFYQQVDQAGGAWSSVFAARNDSWASMTHGGGDITITIENVSGYAVADIGKGFFGLIRLSSIRALTKTSSTH